MQLDVVVLRRRSTEEIGSWKYGIDEQGEIITVHKDGNSLTSDEAWRELAVTINQTDVFLVVRGLLLGNVTTLFRLENIIDEARNHTRGADIYLVWDQIADNKFTSLYEQSRTKLEQFFRAVINGRVTDLIEVTGKAKRDDPDEYSRLSLSAAVSKQRWDRLRGLVNEDGWEILLHDRSCLISCFLETLFEKEPELATGDNLAVFYEHDPRLKTMGGLTYLYGKSDKFYGGGNLFAATVFERDLNDLRVLWRVKNPGTEAFHFNGIMEWLYAFVRLRHAGRRGGA